MKITRVERVKNMQENHGSERWLVGFTDLTTLLLAFFILLFSTVQVKNATWIEASKSMRSEFSGDKQITEATGKPGEVDSSRTWLSSEREAGLDVRYLASLVRKWSKADPVLRNIEIKNLRDAVQISLPGDTNFDAGSDRLTPDGQMVIQHLSPFLRQLPNTLEIVGHADPQQVDDAGRFGSNWHLSLARAYAVARALKNAGYGSFIDIHGKGISNLDSLPKNLPVDVRNKQARRVDLRIHMLQPE